MIYRLIILHLMLILPSCAGPQTRYADAYTREQREAVLAAERGERKKESDAEPEKPKEREKKEKPGICIASVWCGKKGFSKRIEESEDVETCKDIDCHETLENAKRRCLTMNGMSYRTPEWRCEDAGE